MGCVAFGSRRSTKYADADVQPFPAKAAGATAAAVGSEVQGGVKAHPSKAEEKVPKATSSWKEAPPAPTGTLLVCIGVDSDCENLGHLLIDDLNKRLGSSRRLRRGFKNTEVRLSRLTKGGWAVPECEALIPLLTPQWLLTPAGVAALRTVFRLRAMQLGPKLLPVVYLTSFGDEPDALSRALNAPPGQLLREVATTWGCLSSSSDAALDDAADWAVGRLELLFAPLPAGSTDSLPDEGELEDPLPPPPVQPENPFRKSADASGLTQATWRRSNIVVPLAAHIEEGEVPGAVWQANPNMDGVKSPMRPANMPSLRPAAGAHPAGSEDPEDPSRVVLGDKASKLLRQAAQSSARQVAEDQAAMEPRPRRASEPLPEAMAKPRVGLQAGKTRTKDWADAMRDALGVPDDQGSYHEGPGERSSSKKQSKEAPGPELPSVGGPVAPVPSQLEHRTKTVPIPPLPRAASASATGHARRLQPWRPKVLVGDGEQEPVIALEEAMSMNHGQYWVPEPRPRTPGRFADVAQTAPTTPKGRQEDWDHFDLQGTGFYYAEVMSPSAFRMTGAGTSASWNWKQTSYSWDPTETWWGAHPAETHQNVAAGASREGGLDENGQQDDAEEAEAGAAAEGGTQSSHFEGKSSDALGPQEEPTEAAAGRNAASKLDAMTSLKVDLPPLPGQTGPSDLLAVGGAMPSEQKVTLEAKFSTLALSTRLHAAKGGGGFGTKHIAVEQRLNRRVVCWSFQPPKHMEAPRRNELEFAVAAEVEKLQEIRHSRLCPYLASEFVDGCLYVILGYAPGGSVADWLVDAGPLSEAPSRHVAKAVLEGLSHLHRHHVVHGAVRGGNILLGPGSAIRLCDFGLLCLREGRQASTSSAPGEPKASLALSNSAAAWMSPEVLEGKPPSQSSDIWSLGCLVAEMALGRPPALGAAFRARQAEAAEKAAQPRVPLLMDEQQELHESSRNFVALCMRYEPSQRPIATKLLAGFPEEAVPWNDAGE